MAEQTAAEKKAAEEQAKAEKAAQEARAKIEKAREEDTSTVGGMLKHLAEINAAMDELVKSRREAREALRTLAKVPAAFTDDQRAWYEELTAVKDPARKRGNSDDSGS